MRFLVFLILLTPISARALTLQEIPARVIAGHPSLKAAKLAVAEAQARHLAAGRLSNPTTGLQFQNQSRVSPGVVEVSVDQSFPITRRLKLEKKLTAQLVTAAELEVRDATRKFIAEAQALAVQMLALQRQHELRKEQMALATKLAEFVKGRAAAGELSALDAAQAHVDAQRLVIETRRIETESVSLLGALKPLLGIAPAAELTLTGDLPAPAMPCNETSWKQRPDYQLAQARIAVAHTDTDLAKSRKWQDVSAGLFTAREWQLTTPNHTQGTGYVGFRVSLALPFWNKNEGEIAEKIASAERARLESEALSKLIASESDTARKEMQSHAALAKETRDTLLPLIIEQTTKLEKAYETGQAELITVLRARDQRVQLEAIALDAERDFHLARIRYEAAIGQHVPTPAH
jgi:outer membrane protein, heavy metal efflux system